MSANEKSIKPRTKDDLLRIYADTTWQERYLEISDVRDFLRACILSETYTIPDSLNNAINLTDAGSRFQQILTAKHSVPAKEARVLTFLTLAYIDPFVDVNATDPSLLRASLTEQMLEKRIFFPHAYGRLLYDRGADLFKHEIPRLTHEETLKLLDDTPLGYSQIGKWTTGPLGMVESMQKRWIPPRRRIPLYHCPSLGCTQVHLTELETNHAAKVNQFGFQLSKALTSISESPSEWAKYEAELVRPDKRQYDDKSRAATHWLIGDCLSEVELRGLLTFLVDESPIKKQIRSHLEPLGLRGSSTEIGHGHCPAGLMQLVMIADDSSLVQGIDTLVRRKQLIIHGEEVRRPVVNRGYGYGHYDLQPEIGAHGVRFVGGYEDLAPLRLKRLILKLYPSLAPADIIEFDWQLRGTDEASASGKLEQFLRNHTPDEVVQRLCLASRANLITSSTDLELDPDDYVKDDIQVTQILWKLGYRLKTTEDLNSDYWQYHNDMVRLAQTANVSAVVDESAVRSLATNLFVALEGVLDDALAFTTWLLLMDHLAEIEPFTYHADHDRIEAFKLLDQIACDRNTPTESVHFSDRNELYALCRGFAILADHLTGLQKHTEDYLRPPEGLPVSKYGSDLKTYPFAHSHLTLDLTSDSHETIIALLKETSRLMLSADVPSVRNSWQHYRRSAVPLAPLIDCLQIINTAVTALENAGLSRIKFSHTGLSYDAWGRGFNKYEDSRGREITIATPTSLAVEAMPRPTESQYLVTSAALSDSGDFVRCRSLESSEFSKLWTGFPVRKHEGKSDDPNNKTTLDAPVDEGARIVPPQ